MSQYLLVSCVTPLDRRGVSFTCCYLLNGVSRTKSKGSHSGIGGVHKIVLPFLQQRHLIKKHQSLKPAFLVQLI